MSETKNPGEKKLSVSGKTLSLKPRTETGVVRQSFSHGRTKQVVVEVKKRRTPGAEAKPEPAAPVAAKPAAGLRPVPTAKAPPPPAATPAPAASPAAKTGLVLRTLTDEERNR